MHIKIQHILTAAFALLASVALHAEKVELSRVRASELYVALSSIEAGLAPSNTIAAADNLNALRPHVEALDKGKAAFQRASRKLAKDNAADVDAQLEKLVAELEGKGDEKISVDLTPLALSDDELQAAKVRPATLAVIRQYLLKRK